MHVADADDLGRIAVGNEVHGKLRLVLVASGLQLLGPEVVVLDNHHTVAARDFLLAVEHARAYTIIIYVGTAVRTGHHDGIVGTIVGIGAHQGLDQFVAGQHAHLAVAAHGDAGQHFASPVDALPQAGGIGQHPRGSTLPHHFGQVGFGHTQAVPPHHGGAQGRTLLLAHGRQLGGVAHQEQAAVHALVDIAQQVVEQLSRAEGRTGKGLAARNHRGFVDHEHGALQAIEVHAKSRVLAGKGLLPVNHPMDGACRPPRAVCQHLGRPAGGGEQHHGPPQGHQRAHQGTDQRRLARTGITTQDKDLRPGGIGGKTGQPRCGLGLQRRK